MISINDTKIFCVFDFVSQISSNIFTPLGLYNMNNVYSMVL